MKAKELWDLLEGDSNQVDNKRYPRKDIFIKGSRVNYVEKGESWGYRVVLSNLDNEADVDYSVYGTPIWIESTTYKFAKSLKSRFGKNIFVKLDGKDRDYITNSYHIPVFEEIDAFSKLKIESKFQKLSPGGAISYVETPNLTQNTDAVMEIIKFIYDNIMYAELNTKSDYCQVCGYEGEILINDKLEWYCPNCGNKDHTKLNVARRTCGYIGLTEWVRPLLTFPAHHWGQ